MRTSIILITIAAAIGLTCATASAQLAPATRPAGVNVSGRVSVSGKWELQKADLTHAVMYLSSDPVLDAATNTIDHATVAQRNKMFIPNFIVVAKGTDVEFPNWDDFDHNVFSRSKAAPAFDLDRYPKGQSKSRVFDKIGIVQIFCNIHPGMRAVVFVTPNSYFARADASGKFQLNDVPPGKYELVAWHEWCGEQRQAIEIGSNSPAELSISLSENRQNIVTTGSGPKESGYGIERGLGIKRERLDLPVVKEAHPAIDPEKN